MMRGYNSGSDATCQRIPEFSIGAELGVWMGDTSAKFCKKASLVYLVDPWSIEPYKSSEEDYAKYIDRYSKIVGSSDPKDFQKYYDKIHNSVVARFKGNTRAVIKRMTTNQFFDTCKEKLDWVYVDADHSYEGCLNDLRRSVSILKPNGIIFGDDYGNKVAVKKAVDDFIAETGLKFNNFYTNQFEILL